MWDMVWEKSSMLQRDMVSRENLAVKTKLGASIIFRIMYALKIWIAITALTYKL